MRSPTNSQVQPNALTRTFQAFFASEKSGGILLLLCTAISLWLANSTYSAAYLAFLANARDGPDGRALDQ